MYTYPHQGDRRWTTFAHHVSVIWMWSWAVSVELLSTVQHWFFPPCSTLNITGEASMAGCFAGNQYAIYM